MRTITVQASTQYDIIIGSGLLHSIGSEAAVFDQVKKVCVVSDSNVWPLYGAKVAMSLRNAGLDALCYIFQAGEQSKNFAEYVKLINFLAENHVTRSDLLIALGGGVVGDLTGFAAATYLRGIRWVQLPTTLLAAVDSSVGGKTGIDLPAGKNLCGAFYQPSLVLCDTDTLFTLPEDIFIDGCAEIIKYGILYDAEFFRYLESSGPGFDRERVIARCIELKRDAVMLDEYDTGARMMLNLGHTIGHAIESCSNYTISHGTAVAIGTVAVTRAVHCIDTERIIACFQGFGLSVQSPFPAEVILPYILSDKKRNGDKVRMIAPNHVGDCHILQIPAEEVLPFIKEGL